MIIAAKDEQARITATVRAALQLPEADLVIVVDDGSTDRTAAAAGEAGAVVVSHARNRGKAAAMETGAIAIAAIESQENDHRSPRALLFLDADLEESATQAGPLIEPVVSGAADVTIAVLPTQHTAGGGRGLVVDLARTGIARATGWAPRQPLSGQRCLTRRAFDAARPLAPGWGVETGMTIDLLRQGFRLLEVDVTIHHRVTGTDWRAQLHRGKQYRDVLRALATRGIRPSLPARLRRS
ncbi:glycosyltransferase [Actinobacteria bacterium YIM 96077]|uniref:Glucosyl-3-phosphoglycerate synthase n=1 Tax=Phytoactinopolyspora halophila TaxID=1981511 RepID=A0A329R0X9_9ACTN|nr:glycosyltransferase [Actinobacteria bacterium YIM 96077]RAW18197.1 glycosyltransferase family 2 protein [Phytoactinopolyspora halophila]